MVITSALHAEGPQFEPGRDQHQIFSLMDLPLDTQTAKSQVRHIIFHTLTESLLLINKAEKTFCF